MSNDNYEFYPDVGDYDDNLELEDFSNCERSLNDGDNNEGINFNIFPIENVCVNTISIVGN